MCRLSRNQLELIMNHCLTKTAFVLSLALSAALASATTDRSTTRDGKSMYGAMSSPSQAVKVVDVESAKFVNVVCGETVTFRSGDKSFSWKFEVLNHQAVDLMAVAPKGFTNKSLKVYITPNLHESK